MATLENGYTRIANEILEQIAQVKLNGTQFRILMIVWRYTYGFQRKEHELSLTFIAKATDINKMQVQRELTKLIDMKIIKVIQEASFNKTRIIAFNKNCNQWANSEQLAKKLTGSELDKSTVSEKDNSTVSELANQERNNIKKTINKGDSDFPDEEQLKSDFEKIYSIYPKKTTKASAFSNYKKWLKGKQVDGKKIKLNNKQIYIGVYEYVKQQDDIGAELKFYKNFSTLMGNQLLDFVPSDEEMRIYEN